MYLQSVGISTIRQAKDIREEDCINTLTKNKYMFQ